MTRDHNLTDAERRVVRAEQESVDLEVRSPRLPDDVAAMVTELHALVPQMREDAEIHRTWTTEAAKADYAKPSARPLVDHIGDAEWHTKWADFYDRAARVMGSAADAVEAQAAEIERLERALTQAVSNTLARDGKIRHLVASTAGNVVMTGEEYDHITAEVERLRARVALHEEDHRQAVATNDTITAQRDDAQDTVRLYGITYGPEGMVERARLRARVAEYEGYAKRAKAIRELADEDDRYMDAIEVLTESLAALAPADDNEGGTTP
jgi:hypothetical protein